MKRLIPTIAALLALSIGSTCAPDVPVQILPVETRFAMTNFSTQYYVAFAMRVHGDDLAAYAWSPLLAPGATYRDDFLTVLGVRCPDALDIRVLLYERANVDVPIGLDATESVGPTPIAAGEVLNVPACSVEPVEVYTIVNWDAPEGTARVKFAQDTAVEAEIRRTGLFPNAQAVWEVTGVDAALATIAAPPLAANEPIAGRVTLTNGTGVENIGVLLRTRFRVRLDDGDPNNDPDSGWSDAIAVTKTDATGAFAFDRPAGAYRIEAFADGYLFRPAVVDVETPLALITLLVEPE